MKAIVQVKTDNAQLRARSTDTSELIRSLDKDDTVTYTVTKYHKGWYFIFDLQGWVKMADIIIVKMLEDYDDGDFSGGDEDDIQIPGGEILYDAVEIVKAINSGSSIIDASKVALIQGNSVINLATLIKSLNNSLTDMQDAVTKVNNMPAIPELLVEDENKALTVSVVEDEGKNKAVAKWKDVDYNFVINKPSTDTKIEW